MYFCLVLRRAESHICNMHCGQTMECLLTSMIFAAFMTLLVWPKFS